LRRAETKRRNRNGEQEEKSRHEEGVTQGESPGIVEDESGKEDGEKTCGCQEVQAGGKEKVRQKIGSSGWEIYDKEGCSLGSSNERTR
jgi:hypothetical protein